MFNEKSVFPKSHRLCDGGSYASIEFNDGIKLCPLKNISIRKSGRLLFGRFFICKTSIGLFDFQIGIQFFYDLVQGGHRLEFIMAGRQWQS